jgi:hypothetical protein
LAVVVAAAGVVDVVARVRAVACDRFYRGPGVTPGELSRM